MKRSVVVLHGNCVAAILGDVLASLPGAGDKFDVTAFAFGAKGVPDVALPTAELLITQNRIGSRLLPLPALVDKLPREIRTLRMPPLFLQSLWPLSCVDPRARRDRAHPFGSYPRSETDRLALDVMRAVPDPNARREAYFAVDIHSVVDLRRLHEIEAELLMQYEQDCDLQLGAHLLATFRDQRLFYAHHHPTADLLFFIAAQILMHPSFSPFRHGSLESGLAAMKAFLDERKPFRGEEVPIHPAVARFFELKWWSPDMIYRLHEKKFTFDQWLDAYMAEPLP